MQKLFQSFEKESILYLHFKSNTNLEESLINKADYDVLVEKRRILDVERIITENNGKRHNPPHIGNYPGVDNWLVFDDNSGEIFHLHLHYQLATGKFLVKDYILPWEDILFSTRIKDSQSGIFITDPSLELILLATRCVLKSKPFDFIKKILGIYSIPKSLKKEWDDLYEKSDYENLKRYIECLFPKKSNQMVSYLSKERLSNNDYRGIHCIVRDEMRVHRRLSPIASVFKSSIYRIEDLSHKLWSRKFNGTPIIKKTSLQGGLIIAFIGVDGAGKSTISNDISKWIGRKIECKRFYMGTGDGKTTLFASLLKRINVQMPKTNKNQLGKVDDTKNEKDYKKLSFIKSPFLFLKKYMKMCLIMSVEKNNLKKIKTIYRYKLNGGISVLDRFPQVEIEGQNDGPKMPTFIKFFGDKKYVRKRMLQESRYLDIVKVVKPDIIFRLNISVETCLNRKPENTNRVMFEKKISDLNRLHFQNANIVNIDAEKTYSEELLTIKKYLWNYI